MRGIRNSMPLLAPAQGASCACTFPNHSSMATNTGCSRTAGFACTCPSARAWQQSTVHTHQGTCHVVTSMYRVQGPCIDSVPDQYDNKGAWYVCHMYRVPGPSKRMSYASRHAALSHEDEEYGFTVTRYHTTVMESLLIPHYLRLC